MGDHSVVFFIRLNSPHTAYSPFTTKIPINDLWSRCMTPLAKGIRRGLDLVPRRRQHGAKIISSYHNILWPMLLNQKGSTVHRFNIFEKLI